MRRNAADRARPGRIQAAGGNCAGLRSLQQRLCLSLPEIEMRYLLLLALLPLLACERVDAAQYCVESAAELQAALDTSVANGQDDYIQMEATFTLLTAGLTFFSSEDHVLALTGG
jgi:hypothetical protein